MQAQNLVATNNSFSCVHTQNVLKQFSIIVYNVLTCTLLVLVVVVLVIVFSCCICSPLCICYFINVAQKQQQCKCIFCIAVMQFLTFKYCALCKCVSYKLFCTLHIRCRQVVKRSLLLCV